MWRAAGVHCRCHTYRVIPTGQQSGYIEALENALPVLGADFSYSRRLHDSAVGAFAAGFVLGLGDRHQDNMLLVCRPFRNGVLRIPGYPQPAVSVRSVHMECH